MENGFSTEKGAESSSAPFDLIFPVQIIML